MPEIEKQSLEKNMLAGTKLIPWLHGSDADLQPTVSRIIEASQDAAHYVLSVDSIRPSDLKSNTTKMLDDVLQKSHPAQATLLNNIPNLENAFLIGSDPLSFMILSSPELPDGTEVIKKYAEILVSMAAGATLAEASLRYYTKEATSLGLLSRRDAIRLLFVGSIGVMSGIANRMISAQLSQVDRVKQAAELNQGIGVGKPGYFARAQGIDERTLLDSLKHRKIRQVLLANDLIETTSPSISVWGNDHFLTDDFNSLARIAAEKGAAQNYVAKGKQWLAQVLPEAQKIVVAKGYSEESFRAFVEAAYFDLDHITLTKVVESQGRKYLVPLVTNGDNSISLVS